MKIIIAFIRGLIQYFLSKPPAPKPPPVIHIPKKPRIHLDIDISKSRKWTGLCWHHSATRDNLVHNNTNAIIRYHSSFRIDYTSVANPQKEKQQGIEYVLYRNGSLYKKSEYDYYWREYKKKKNDPSDKRSFIPAWMDVGYPVIIEAVDNKMVLNWGRPLDMVGAHAGYKEFNENYIGVCAIGNFDQQPVPPDVWTFAQMVSRTLMDIYPIPLEKVIGHREVYDKMGVKRQKECPGRYWDMDKFRAEL